MRHIDRLPKPRILENKEAEWQKKYEEKLAENPHARPDSSKYAHQEIKDALYAMSYSKCYYCETKLTDSVKEIDHFVEVSVNPCKAYDWDNLCLACNNCNDKYDHKTIPVTDALDPCRDSNEEIKANISFEREQIFAVPDSKKGLNTIKKYHLNTELLDLKRSRWLNKLLVDVGEIQRQMIANGRRKMTEDERKKIMKYMMPDQPYSLMCEVFITENLRELL